MGWSEMWHEAKQLHGLEPAEPRPQGVLTADEVGSFMKAAEERPIASARTIEQVRAELRRSNFVRMGRLEKDMRWMKRQMKKMGLNPEDAKYVL